MLRRTLNVLFPRYAYWTPDCYTCGAFKACINRHDDHDIRENREVTVVQTSNELFNALQEALRNAQYMPSLAKRAQAADRKQALVYLTLLSINRHASPFSAEQQNIIGESNQAKRFTAFCLNIGVCVSPIIACTGLVGLMALNIHISPTVLVATPVSVGACCSALNTFLSCVVTGTNPDDSSNKANRVQNIMNGVVRETFLLLAQDLVEMKTDNSGFALAVAENLEIDNLKAEFSKWSYGDDFDSIIKPLETAQLFVLDRPLDFKGLPSSTIRSHIRLVQGGPYEPSNESRLDGHHFLAVDDMA